MGYWGYEVMDGDSPEDRLCDYRSYLYEMDTKEQAFEKIKKDILDVSEVDQGEVLALAYIEMNSMHRLSDDVYASVLTALEIESSKEVLDTWKEPERRLEALNEFKEELLDFRKGKVIKDEA